MRSVMLRTISIMALVLSVGAALSPATARGQNIYVTNSSDGTIGEYTTSGAVVNASLVSGLTNAVWHCRVWIEPVCRELRHRHDWRIHHVGCSRERLAGLGVE